MEATTIIYLVLAVLVGVGLAYWQLRQGPLTAGGALDQVHEAVVVAQTLVAAAEQMANTGTISRDARFNYVFTRLRDLFPSLSEDMLVAAIEGAVWIVTKAGDLLEPDD